MKVKSFGCSFIFGNELADDGRDLSMTTASQLTWPSLIAKKLEADYSCFARPGSGNFRILEQIMHQAGLNEPDVLFIVGWTWIERFDYVVDGKANSPWREYWNTITPTTETEEAKVYYQFFHNQLRDKLQSLICIRSAIDILKEKSIPFVMTCIDDLLLDRQWHIPVSVTDTQDYIQPYISKFEGKNFLDWSRNRGYAIGRWLHPLEEAHVNAANLLFPQCQELIQI